MRLSAVVAAMLVAALGGSLAACGGGSKDSGTANVAFGKDFADPQSLLDPTFNGARVTQAITSNYSMLDDKAINSAMAEATTSAGADRDRAWAQINRMVAEQAPAIPWVWDKYALIESNDVAGVTNAYFNSWDFSFTSLK
jgi:peptide/nickel transport system substrate-binding protein